MRTRLLLSASAGLAFLIPVAFAQSAQAQPASALAGQVSSAKEGVMEGVVVSAKKDGSTITVSVASDTKGHYSFPAAKLEPVHYSLKIRATGYELEGAMGVDPATVGRMRGAAEFLASINLSKGPERSYTYKTLPRPTGRATHVVVTEYDLPRKTIEPHDVMVDTDGMVWYSDFGALFIGKMDPKTGKVTEYPIPKIKEGFPVGTLDLEQDHDGNFWVAMMYQGGVAKLDKKTGKVQTWSVPKEWQTDATQQSFVSPTSWHVDGKVWVKNSDRAQILRLDPKTSQWENLGSFTHPETKKGIGSHGINADLNK